ncbi:MAG: hypothetical protein U9Q79_12125, partial [Candidatus Hydrogenedentes bacterium]|nr:hypothetical protein [Candidatus Hydrogenedentota bacterium]
RVSREPSPPVAKRLRKPGFILLVSLSAIIVVLALGNSMAKLAEYYGQPEIEGEAIIASKEIEKAGTPEESYVLYVDILRPEGERIRCDVVADKASFEEFFVGQQVPLVYQLNRSGDNARIVTLYLPVPAEETETESLVRKEE